jgi:hypothetical protein
MAIAGRSRLERANRHSRRRTPGIAIKFYIVVTNDAVKKAWFLITGNRLPHRNED